jgi:hypothetical protein
MREASIRGVPTYLLCGAPHCLLERLVELLQMPATDEQPIRPNQHQRQPREHHPDGPRKLPGHVAPVQNVPPGDDHLVVRQGVADLEKPGLELVR